MSAAADIAFDPFSPDMCVDPYPHYRRLREHAPVWRSPLGFWLLTRHADLATFFTDRSLRREYEVGQTLRTGPQVGEQEYFHLFRRMLFILDNPEHQRVRRLFAAAFTPAGSTSRAPEPRPSPTPCSTPCTGRAGSIWWPISPLSCRSG